MDFLIIAYVILGLLPSFIWLSFYLKEDLHPEPKKMILKVFLMGGLITIPVFFVQIGFNRLLELTNLDPAILALVHWFLIIALSEELFKYFVFRVNVFDNYNLDEPIDAMIYMIVGALGFAAVENILYLYSSSGPIPLPFDQTITTTLVVAVVRFAGATFLHTLCSAMIGYGLAMSFCRVKRKYMPLILGIIVAVFFHGLFNYALITFGGSIQIAVPVAILIILATLILIGFSRLKKMKGTCNVE
jgi:RsiW-degrading membrane proteinase PrsW (M82 family)